jgi:hypothetical protein
MSGSLPTQDKFWSGDDETDRMDEVKQKRHFTNPDNDNPIVSTSSVVVEEPQAAQRGSHSHYENTGLSFWSGKETNKSDERKQKRHFASSVDDNPIASVTQAAGQNQYRGHEEIKETSNGEPVFWSGDEHTQRNDPFSHNKRHFPAQEPVCGEYVQESNDLREKPVDESRDVDVDTNVIHAQFTVPEPQV